MHAVIGDQQPEVAGDLVEGAGVLDVVPQAIEADADICEARRPDAQMHLVVRAVHAAKTAVFGLSQRERLGHQVGQASQLWERAPRRSRPQGVPPSANQAGPGVITCNGRCIDHCAG